MPTLKTQVVVKKQRKQARLKQTEETEKMNCVPHFKNVIYIFLWFRGKDKLACLSLCERETREECSRDGSSCRVGNHRWWESWTEDFLLIFPAATSPEQLIKRNMSWAASLGFMVFHVISGIWTNKQTESEASCELAGLSHTHIQSLAFSRQK